MKEKRKGKYYRLTQDQFVERCKNTQIVPIDYSKIQYICQHTSYEVTCIKHNHTYNQLGQALVEGDIGCVHCLKDYKSKVASDNLDIFIGKFTEKHPDKNFDFSKSVYIKSNTKIDVICDKGHEFSSKPNNLLTGYGCPRCYEIKKGFIHNKGKDGYITKFKEIHGDRYDYSLVEEFKNCKHKVTVVCESHGNFLITPDNHVQGKGCPLCGKAGFKAQQPAYFYILQVTDNVIKFGITNNVERRLKEINKKCSFDVQVLHTFYFENGYDAQSIETLVYRDKSIVRNVVSKLDMPSGYVETTYLSNLTKILNIVDDFTNDLSG